MSIQQITTARVPLTSLSTLWFQVSGTECNLKCTHCFISCGPGVRRHTILSRERIKGYLEEAKELGVKEIYLTGGEPFLNPELPYIIEDALRLADVTVLTNATLVAEKAALRVKNIAGRARKKLAFRVSMESTSEEENDKIRGGGAFRRAAAGVKNLIDAGFEPIITITEGGVSGGGTARFAGPEDFTKWLKGLGSKDPQIKTLPLIHIGRAEKNYGPYKDKEMVTAESLKDFPINTLQCSYARMVTSEGVFACPILIDDPGARLGKTISEGLGACDLASQACYTCVEEGLSCSNTSCCGVSREDVKSFYGGAAVQPQPGLCCPTIYDGVETDHIPEEVLDVSYGCGSPVTLAGIRHGETMLDLGSGGGIDCFIAARLAGPSGRVIGVDMTDEMLEKANRNKKAVSERLGYDNMEFHKGFLEAIPAPSAAVDLVTSNCVINLTVDKGPVFREIFRILKDGGRFVISDVVSDKEVPEEMRDDKELWGECISGALTVDEFLNHAVEAGFHGAGLLSKDFYREAGGIRFYSITFRAYKFIKSERCVYSGQKAIYTGPYKSVSDDDGHEFPIGVPVEVCTDTAEKLGRPPYKGSFVVIGPDSAPGAESGYEEEDCKTGCC
ncbi:MAG: methyltransferase domain-containing protein [Thermodesulfobacteriota bacterium]